MTSIRKIIENSFDELGVVYDEMILKKCVELCVEHGVEDADELVDSWMAFSVSHLRGDNPTPQHLARFEREIVARKAKKKDKSYSENYSHVNDIDGDAVAAYNHSSQRPPQTPEVGRNRLAISPRGNFSPASFSPISGTPSSKYAARNNSGRIICGEPSLEIENVLDGPVSVAIFGNQLEREKFMAYNLVDSVQDADVNMRHVLSQIGRRFSLNDTVPITSKHPVKVLVAGRISCDADGKLNAESLLLEASQASGGDIIRLDLSSIPSYSVFPGQVVAVEGLNVTGHQMIAQKLWCDGSTSDSSPNISIKGSLKIIVACGPLATTDCLTYQTLIDVLDVVVKEDPHLLLLTGPLIDHNHPVVSSLVMAETFQDMFDRLIHQIMESVKNLRTHVVLVSSHRESHGPAVFPTLPVPSAPHPKLSIVSDPSVINVGEVVIAVTSIDVLMHIGKEEVAFLPHSGDRLARLAGHILQQQSFYPIRPPLDVPLDPCLERYLALPVKPHILILPSDLRCFIKEIDGCTVVNPEHLARGVIGGTYAKLKVSTNGIVTGQIIKI